MYYIIIPIGMEMQVNVTYKPELQAGFDLIQMAWTSNSVYRDFSQASRTNESTSDGNRMVPRHHW